jgi:hypothetical protein
MNRKKIKYPNNYNVFLSTFSLTKLRKHLKKNDNRMVDALMGQFELRGDKVKKAMHQCENFNVQLLVSSYKLFGESWINQKENLVLYLLNSSVHTPSFNEETVKDFSKEELKKIFNIFILVYVKNSINYFTFMDHIRLFSELKNFGETVKWMSKNEKEFSDEHIELTEKLSYYTRGYYKRIYPKNLIDSIPEYFTMDEEKYYPVLLTDSKEYNEESLLQSNCVKTYIGKSSAIIISLRKNEKSSDERGTIEYNLSKKTDGQIFVSRVQYLGKFNQRLDETWSDSLNRLDDIIKKIFHNSNIEMVKLTKLCANGKEFFSDSEWSSDGILRWTYNNIDNEKRYYDHLLFF